MSHRSRIALASVALVASLTAGAPPAQAAPRSLDPDLLDHFSALLERAWSALLGPPAQSAPWEKSGPCADPDGKPLPHCPTTPATAGDNPADGLAADPHG